MNRITNWIHYQATESDLRRQFKSMLIFLWNEKDWLKEQYPEKKQVIEKHIDESSYMCVAGDLANTIKHRIQRKNARSAAIQTDYFGKVTMGCGAERRMYYISLGNGKIEDSMEILRGALDEFSELRRSLISGAL